MHKHKVWLSYSFQRTGISKLLAAVTHTLLAHAILDLMPQNHNTHAYINQLSNVVFVRCFCFYVCFCLLLH